MSDSEPRSIYKKSPQELAAQVRSVYSTWFESARSPNGPDQDKWFQKARAYVGQLLEGRPSNADLEPELAQLHEIGRELGVYLPTEDPNFVKNIASAKQKYLDWGYSEEDAQEAALADLAQQGYVAELRRWRRDHEDVINQRFTDYTKEHPLSEEEERAKVESLKELCIFVHSGETHQLPQVDFPSGNFLFHGAPVEQAVNIIDTGVLMNGKALADKEEERAKVEHREPRGIKRNSGFEGISWNFNTIGALPGDRYHLVGWLTSPESVLDETTQLVIPSRPAPHELVLLNGAIDANEFYRLKNQEELIFSFSLGESNSVWSNIAQLVAYKQNSESDTPSQFIGNSMLFEYQNVELSDEEMSSLLRDKFTVRTGQTIEFADNLLQQTHNEIPVGAVWIQGLIDSGRLAQVSGFEDVTTVREVIAKIDKSNLEDFLTQVKRERDFVRQADQQNPDIITALEASIDEMYFVVPQRDLHKWLKVLARSSHKPKGIIVYDHNRVRLEDFASDHIGDKGELTKTLESLIPPSASKIDYESELLGTKINDKMLAGYKNHVIGEAYLSKRKSVRLGHDGRLAIS